MHGNTNKSQETGGILISGSCGLKATIYFCFPFGSLLTCTGSKPSFCCLQSKVLANAFVSKGDKSTDLIYSFGNKKEFLLFGENTKLQRNSAYCWLLELAVEERMVSSEPTIVKIRIVIEGQQGSTLWHRVCLCGMYWDKNGTQSPSCVKGRISYPSSVGLHDFPCRARRLRKGMLQDATAHGYPLRMHGGGWMGGR